MNRLEMYYEEAAPNEDYAALNRRWERIYRERARAAESPDAAKQFEGQADWYAKQVEMGERGVV